MKNIEKRVMIFISCMMALLIMLQHHYVNMYFDDYGYASLSYAGFENHVGMSYGLNDILRFLRFHYLNWGGRVLYFFFEIVIFRLGGLTLMQVIQTIIVFAVSYIAEMVVPLPKELGAIVGGLWLVIFIPALSWYYLKKENYLFLSLLIAGVCTQIMMIVSPAIPLRLHVMFEFILHILLAECIVYIYRKTKETQKGKRALKVSMIMLTMYAVCNMTFVIAGYQNNYEIYQKNNQELLEAGKQYKDGKIAQKIVLNKLRNDTFAQMMPYQEGFRFIEEWIKNYYELPAETVFVWE